MLNNWHLFYMLLTYILRNFRGQNKIRNNLRFIYLFIVNMCIFLWCYSMFSCQIIFHGFHWDMKTLIHLKNVMYYRLNNNNNNNSLNSEKNVLFIICCSADHSAPLFWMPCGLSKIANVRDLYVRQRTRS